MASFAVVSSHSSSSLPLSIPFTHHTFFSPTNIHLKPTFLASSFLLRAKFERFSDDFQSRQQNREVAVEQEEIVDEDGDLPCDLVDAVRQSGGAAAAFANSGGMRAIVELLIPQLQFLDAEGAQAEVWELSKIFLDTLIKETGVQSVKAIFPDAGATALLKFQWKDASFGFASLSDRKPIDKEDEIAVMILPDYQMLEYVEKIASKLSDEPPRPLIMWNPRLVSEDVGVGFNVRKLRRYFLNTFTTVYSMKPFPDGALFRCYPGMWKVFYDDKDRPNRYLLAKELPTRPDASDLEVIYGRVAENSGEEKSLLSKVGGLLSSINQFMKAIS